MFFGVSYEQLVYGVLCGLPTQLFFIYIEYRLLDIRRKKLFWGIEAVLLALTVLRSAVPVMLRALVGFAMTIVVPFALSQGGLLRRTLVCTAVTVAMFVFESMVAFEWLMLTGTAYAIENLVGNLPVTLLCAYSMLACWVIALVFVQRALASRKGAGSDAGVGPGGWRRLEQLTQNGPPSKVLLPFALVCVVQLVLEFSLCALILQPQAAGNAALCAMMTVVGALQLVSLVLLYRSMGRYAAKRRADAEAAFLEEHTAEALRRYEDTTRFVDDAARLRHDFRNQMQLARILADEGDVEGARKQLADMAHALKVGEAQ